MKFNADKHKWGGSGIERATYDYIISILPEQGGRILELGAGHVSTPALMLDFDITSVEHNKEYAGINPNTIYAPLVDGYYDLAVLKKELNPPYDLIIIDGADRGWILDNISLFGPINNIIVHDTNRPKEKALVKNIAKLLGMKYKFFTKGDYWAHIW